METSPFKRLPAELRTRIYEEVFTFSSVRCQDGRWRVYDGKHRMFRLTARLSPTLVCKQIRDETLHLLMALNEPVIGNEKRDVDPYYEFWMGPKLLVDPCTWAARAIDKGKSPFFSASTVFRLNLWIYPCMRDSMRVSDWHEFEKAFAGLVDDGFPGKVVVTLHFYVDYQPLGCEVMQGRAAESTRRYEYGRFEIGLDDDGCGPGDDKGLLTLFDEKREVLSRHESHDRSRCGVPAALRLSEQLDQTEETAVRVVETALIKRVERLSLDISGHS